MSWTFLLKGKAFFSVARDGRWRLKNGFRCYKREWCYEFGCGNAKEWMAKKRHSMNDDGGNMSFY
jgi:hypothetical protein